MFRSGLPLKLVLILWIAISPLWAVAQQRGFQTDTATVAPIEISDLDGNTIGTYQYSYALLIGIDDYQNGWPRLKGVNDDLDTVRRELEQRGFQVYIVKNPDDQQLKRAFDGFINRFGVKEYHRLLFYYAGHGHSEKQTYGGSMGYLVPRNAPNPKQDRAGFLKTAMDMQQIEVYAKRIQSHHAIFLFDSCFSGTIFSLPRSGHQPIDVVFNQPVRQFITSGSADETVPDISIFRRQLLTGLDGEADLNGDGNITGSELGEHLSQSVALYSKKTQHPQYGKIQNPYLDKGEFVFRVRTDPKNRTGKTYLLNDPIETYENSELYSQERLLALGVNDETMLTPDLKTVRKPDTDQPGIFMTTPADSAMEVPVTTSLELEFDEPVQMATVTAATDGSCAGTVQLSQNDGAGCIAFSQKTATSLQDDTKAVFELKGSLTHNKRYQLKITPGIKDIANNPLDRSYSIHFTTTSDQTPPRVTHTVPGDSSADIPQQTTVTISFDEPMDPSTLTTSHTNQCRGALQVSRDGFRTCVAMADPIGSSWNNDQNVTLTPRYKLEGSATYRIRVLPSARDAKGNAMHSKYIDTRGFRTIGPLPELSSGFRHVCATFPNGKAVCWGYNAYGELGQGNKNKYGTDLAPMTSLPPILFGDGERPVQTVAGRDHTCSRLNNGRIKCWGRGYGGALGVNIATYGDHANETVAALPALSLKQGKAVQLVLGSGNACALNDAGRVFCWGNGNSGVLGYDDRYSYLNVPHNNVPDFNEIEPIDFGNGKTATQIAMGGHHACAVMSGDQLKCWGSATNGRIGSNDIYEWGRGGLYDRYMNELPDVDLGSGYSVKHVSATGPTCVILNQMKEGNNVVCWGSNNYGQLGQGDSLSRGDSSADSKRTDRIPAIKLQRPAIQISTGGMHVCALLDNKCLKCWGEGSQGELGYGHSRWIGSKSREMENLACINLGTGLSAVSVSVGGSFTCAVLNTGAIKCWGVNGNGQLGQNNRTKVKDPSTIPPIAFE